MKKFVYIFCIALLGAACSKEDVNKSEIVKTIDIPENMVKLSITVPREPQTRATMEGRQMSFAADDQIAVIGTLNAETSVVTLDVESISPLSITFSAAIDENMEIGDYAYFPTSIVNKDNPTQINWPSSFDGTKVQMPMMAKIDVSKNEANFHYLGAMLKVNLASAPSGVNTLEFMTTDNFVGSYNVTFDGDNNISNVVASSVSGNTETLSVNSTGTYYVPIPAGTYSEFQLAMKQGSYYHKQRTSDLDAAINPVRGNIVNLGDFAYDVDQIEEWYYSGVMNGGNNSALGDYTYNRFIKTGANSYQILLYSNNSSGINWDLVDGEGNKWCTTDADQWNGQLYEKDWHFWRSGTDNKNYWVTVVRDGSLWKYNSGNWDVNSDRMWSSGSSCVAIKSSIDSWSEAHYLTKYNYNENLGYKLVNFYIPDNQKYAFKVVSNSSSSSLGGSYTWTGGDGDVTLSDSSPYGRINNTLGNGGDMYFQLTPGLYDIYLDFGHGNFMFVKKPYSE